MDIWEMLSDLFLFYVYVYNNIHMGQGADPSLSQRFLNLFAYLINFRMLMVAMVFVTIGVLPYSYVD